MNPDHKATASALGKLISTHAGREYLRERHQDGPLIITSLDDRMIDVLTRVYDAINAGSARMSVVYLRDGEIDGLSVETEQEPIPGTIDPTVHHDETLRDFVGRLTLHADGTLAGVGITDDTPVETVRAKVFA